MSLKSAVDVVDVPVNRTKPNHVLAIVCAGIVLANLDLFIVNVALPDIARDFGGADARRPVVGLERLCHRLCCPPGVPGPSVRGLSPRPKLPAGHRDLHGGVGGLLRRRQCLDAGGLPPAAGGWRGSDDTDVARPAARHVPAGQAWWRGADLDGDRRLRRGAGPCRGRVAPDLELALDLHRQCADRAGRPGDRLATAAEDRRARHTPAGRMGRRVGDGRRRPADVRHGQGERVGLALRYRSARAWRGACSCWRYSSCTACAHAIRWSIRICFASATSPALRW